MTRVSPRSSAAVRSRRPPAPPCAAVAPQRRWRTCARTTGGRPPSSACTMATRARSHPALRSTTLWPRRGPRGPRGASRSSWTSTPFARRRGGGARRSPATAIPTGMRRPPGVQRPGAPGANPSGQRPRPSLPWALPSGTRLACAWSSFRETTLADGPCATTLATARRWVILLRGTSRRRRYRRGHGLGTRASHPLWCAPLCHSADTACRVGACVFFGGGRGGVRDTPRCVPPGPITSDQPSVWPCCTHLARLPLPVPVPPSLGPCRLPDSGHLARRHLMGFRSVGRRTSATWDRMAPVAVCHGACAGPTTKRLSSLRHRWRAWSRRRWALASATPPRA